MKKADLNTRTLKKMLNARRVVQRWHNKNKRGGNFGINIYYGDGFERGRDKELTGYYNADGDLTFLSYGDLWGVGQKIPQVILKDIELLAKYLLYLNTGGDWLTFLKENNLLEEYQKLKEVC